MTRLSVVRFVGEGLDPPLFPILLLRVSVDSGGSVTLPYGDGFSGGVNPSPTGNAKCKV